jgi:hypothetical protein
MSGDVAGGSVWGKLRLFGWAGVWLKLAGVGLTVVVENGYIAGRRDGDRVETESRAWRGSGRAELRAWAASRVSLAGGAVIEF